LSISNICFSDNTNIVNNVAQWKIILRKCDKVCRCNQKEIAMILFRHTSEENITKSIANYLSILSRIDAS